MGNGGLDSAELVRNSRKAGQFIAKAPNFRVESSVEPHHSIPVSRGAPARISSQSKLAFGSGRARRT